MGTDILILSEMGDMQANMQAMQTCKGNGGSSGDSNRINMMFLTDVAAGWQSTRYF